MYFRWPVSQVGRLLEGRVSRRVYRDCPFIAVSPSTRAEMRRQLDFHGPVAVVPNGIDQVAGRPAPRSPAPAIAVVTRLVRTNGCTCWWTRSRICCATGRS